MATRNWRRLTIAATIVAAGSALAVPVGAQQRDFFPFPFWGGDRGSPNLFGQPVRPPVDYSKAPAPHKPETPPTSTVLVIGDSLADWLGYGLEEALADTPEIGVVRKIRGSGGLIRYEARSDAPDWSQVAKDVLASEKPNAIIVMLGLNDRQSLRDRTPSRAAAQRNGEQPAQPANQTPNQTPNQTSQNPAQSRDETPPAQPGSDAAPDSAPAASDTQRRPQGASYEFHTDKWAELYSKRVDEMIAALKAKGVPVLWVGLPAIRGPRSTSDMSYLDELFRARAEKAGITYVDVWDGFVDDRGAYAVQGPDFEGQIRRLRSGDGVHFTKAGAVKLAYYVEHELRRVLSNRAVPIALPGPEQLPGKAGAAGSRPAIGPVVPLGAIGAGEGSDLLGAGGRPAQTASDPIVTRVLSRGDALAAPAGRADDFSWPRNDAGPSTSGAAADAELPPPAAPPPPLKAAPGKPDVKKPSEAKAGDAKTNEAKPNEGKANEGKANEPKTQAASEAATTRPRRPPRVDLDGAPPRPPLPVGPAPNSR